jgi:adenylate cyclase
MFTDIVGYTALGQRNESLSLALLEEHRNLLRPVFSRHGGKEIKTMGDAFLVEFTSALEAVRCAYDIQRASREYNLSLADDKRVRLRVGVHLGDVVEAHGDVLGDAVNVASRIQTLAEPGGVCITRQVLDHVQNKTDLSFESLGEKSLKNVAGRLEVFKLSMPWENEVSLRSGASANRIAVLPFTNMSPDPQDEFFADGLTEEMISQLSRIHGLRVIARTSVMHYKNANKGVKQIGSELKVTSILEGSLRKAGNRIRITAQLIDAETEEHLWVENYDRDLNDIFAVQSEIATNVASALQLKLLPPPGRKNQQTEKLEAYTLYLRGRFLWNKRSADSVREALSYFEAAVAMDQHYAQAYSGIADCYSILLNKSEIPWSEFEPKARAACERALELDNSLPEAHASLGLLLNQGFEYEGAEREFKAAIELNPGYAPAYMWYALVLGAVGKLEETRMMLSKAEEADPLSPIILHNAAYFDWVNGRDDLAIKKWDRGLEVAPNFDWILFDKASYYAVNSMKTEALAELKLLESVSKDNVMTAVATFLYGCVGEKVEAEKRLEGLLRGTGSRPPQAGLLAWAYAGLGDTDKFYEWLLKSADDRSFAPLFLRTHPLLKGLRSDPRYQEYFRRIKVPV